MTDRTRLPLPEPAYPAGTTGMLGENTWDRHQLRAHAEAETAALRDLVDMQRAALAAESLSADEMREQVRVLREALHSIAWCRAPGQASKMVEALEAKALAALEATK